MDKDKRRISLKESLPKFVSEAKRVEKPFLPSKRLAQSIDLTKYDAAHYKVAKVNAEEQVADEERAIENYYTAKAINLNTKQHELDNQNAYILLTKNFEKTMEDV